MSTIRVGINGYGVIGKRVADAVALQPDMEVVGVADTATDYRVELARLRGHALFGSTPQATVAMGATGLEPTGELGELLANIDVIVDATPKHIGAANKARYDAAGVKSILQGGERHELAGVRRLHTVTSRPPTCRRPPAGHGNAPANPTS